MSIGYILIMATAAVVAILLTLSRMIGFKNVIRYSVLVDFAVSSILVWMFFGTFIGMMIAIIAGLIMAIFLTMARKIYKPAPTQTSERASQLKEQVKATSQSWITQMKEEFTAAMAEDDEPEEVYVPTGSIFNRIKETNGTV